MSVGAILYLWRHPIFARVQWKRKCHPKFVHMQWKLSRSAIIIGYILKIGYACMRLGVWTWSVAGVGFYVISMKYLHYFC